LFCVCGLSGFARAQSLEVTPDEATVFSFSGFEGGPFLAETGTTWTLDDADTAGLDFVVQSDQRWLRVTPTDGTLPGSLVANRTRLVTATIDSNESERLAPGLYAATVTFSNVTNEVGNTTRTVRLRVAPGSFSVTPSFINASTTPSGGNPAPAVVTLRANGPLDLNYRVDWVARSWFNVDKLGGTVVGAGTDTFTISFNTFGLAAGSYSAQITIDNTTNGAGSRQLPLNLVLQSSGASVVILRPDADLVVHGPVGGIPVATQTSTLTNNSDSPVTWNADISEDWISVSPSGGQLAASNGVSGGADEIAIDVRVNAAVNDLKAGSHAATVSLKNVTTTTNATNIGTRVVFVVADPVLRVSAPSAGGSILVSPSGAQVAGGTSRDLVFPFGEVVTLTATAEAGHSFQGWAADFHLDSALENPLVVTLDESRNVSALFAPILQKLTLSRQGQGTGTIQTSPTANIIDNDAVFRYDYGTQVTLQADADSGSVFVRWEGNVPAGAETDNPLTRTLDRDLTVSARFERLVSLTVDVTGGGQVELDPETEDYLSGTTVTLRAIADDGFTFFGWSGGASGAGSPLALTLNEDTVVEALFVEDTGGGTDGFALTIEIQGDGSVTPDGGTFAAGEMVTLIATPDVGASFVGWEQDASGSALTARVTMNGARNVRAVFTTAPTDGGSGRPNPPPFGALCGATGLFDLAVGFLGFAALRGSRGSRRGVSG